MFFIDVSAIWILSKNIDFFLYSDYMITTALPIIAAWTIAPIISKTMEKPYSSSIVGPMSLPLIAVIAR